MKKKFFKRFLITFLFFLSIGTRNINSQVNLNDFYNTKALTKINNKDYEGALIELNESIKIGPSSGQFHYKDSYGLRAKVNYELGNYEEALEDINIYINHFPNQEPSYDLRQTIKYNLEDYDGAIEDTNIMLIINPKSGKAYSYRGLSKLKLEKRKRPAATLKKH